MHLKLHHKHKPCQFLACILITLGSHKSSGLQRIVYPLMQIFDSSYLNLVNINPGN